MYEQPAAPASVGGVLDSGFKLFRACFSQVVGISILANFVSQIPNMVMVGSLDADGIPQFGMNLVIAMLLAMLISVIFYGAIVARIHSVHRGTELGLSESFTVGFSCMLPLLVCMVLYGLAVSIGSLLLIVPGLLLMVSLLFAPYILIIEREGIIASLTRSHQLVWGYWWRTAGLVTIAGFIMIVAFVLVGIVAGIFIALEPESLTSSFSMTQSITSALLGGLVTPLFYALTMAAYYDLKLRRDGDDLAERIHAEPAVS